MSVKFDSNLTRDLTMSGQLFKATLGETYTRIYALLSELRESFHRSGRLDDSNAKLDEVSKLFATYLAFRRSQISQFPDATGYDLIARLQDAFAETVKLPQFQLKNGGSIFGTQPHLVLRDGDESLAENLVSLVRECVDTAYEMRSDERPFDVLNEAFGHFIRDNFRGNVEDAQYMTPPEVVEFVVSVALSDLAADAEFRASGRPLIVLDPSCGVGSFLTSLYHAARATDWLTPQRLHLVGQDKVERMVRLSTINMELFEVGEHHIHVGNSLELGSELDALDGSVDLILTNPPFGARFEQQEVHQRCGQNTPFFSGLKRTSTSIDSELLFIDRNLRLLRDGGRLLIVVPDGVVSAKGIAALLRQHIAKTATLISVIELPSTTFAQAGTRTKTAIVYLQKGRSKKSQKVFIAAAKDLGFQVSSRKGVQVKVSEGANELPAILSAYESSKTLENEALPQVLLKEPSCVCAAEDQVTKGSWTPNHYSALRFETVSKIRGNTSLQLVSLSDLVTFCGDTRRTEVWSDGCAFISVLHILGDGLIDIVGALGHAPKTPGIQAMPGEILMSRINPRIPRVCVAPDLEMKTLCSSEFEVMQCNPEVDPYALAYLLQTEAVQNQIQSLTSGTSASHNRIRTSDLAQVLIPVAKPGSARAKEMEDVFATYRAASSALVKNALRLASLRAQDARLFA